MFCWYTFYGGIRRTLTCFDSSKQFGPQAIMASSATPTPWYCPPPFVDNIRWWDDFFLKFSRPPPPDKPDTNPGHSFPLQNHGHVLLALGSTPNIFFSHAHVLGMSPASSNMTLNSPPSLCPHSTDSTCFRLANDNPEQKSCIQDKNCQERGPPPCAKDERSRPSAGGCAHRARPAD